MIVLSKELIADPLVSVVICSHNRVNTIGQTLDSVLSQKRDFPIEIIVGDDESTDGSRDLLTQYQKKYPSIFVLLFQEHNLGVGGNWASIVKLARGQYIALCDDDDYWHYDEKLQKQVQLLHENNKYGLVYTDYRTLDVNNGEIVERRVYNNPNLSLQQALFKGKYLIVASSTLIRKNLIDKYVSLEDYIKYNFSLQDWPTWILISKYTEFYHLKTSTVTYRKGASSTTNPESYDTVLLRYAKEKVMYKYLCDLFAKDLSYDENGYNSYVNHVLLNLAYKKCDFKSAQNYAKMLISQGNNNLKIRCSLNKISFYLFYIFKILKSAIKK